MELQFHFSDISISNACFVPKLHTFQLSYTLLYYNIALGFLQKTGRYISRALRLQLKAREKETRIRMLEVIYM